METYIQIDRLKSNHQIGILSLSLENGKENEEKKLFMTESLINKKRDKCMIKSKTPIFGHLEYSSGERIRTTTLNSTSWPPGYIMPEREWAMILNPRLIRAQEQSEVDVRQVL